jgi:hypothetical protein
MTDVAPSDLLPDQMTPEAAATRIGELKADPKFSERYLNNETAARDEFKRLHTIVGKGAPDEAGMHRESQLTAMKRHADLPDKCWAQVSRNGPVHQHEHQEALRMKERCLRDRSFVAKYLDGSREEVSLMTRISLILASPIHKEGT